MQMKLSWNSHRNWPYGYRVSGWGFNSWFPDDFQGRST